MGIEQSIDDVITFLDRIIPVFILHILLFILVKRFPIINTNLKHRISEYINSKKYEESRNILKEFEFWNKIPYLFFVLTLIYFHFFSNVSWAFMSVAPDLITPGYCSDELWKENGVSYIREMVSLDTICFDNFGSLDECRSNLVDKYKIDNNDLFERTTGWSKQQTSKWNEYYTLIFGLICMIAICQFYYLWKDFKNKTKYVTQKNAINLMVVIPVMILGMCYSRYQYEYWEIRKFKDENWFLGQIYVKEFHGKNPFAETNITKRALKVTNEVLTNKWGNKMWFY